MRKIIILMLFFSSLEVVSQTPIKIIDADSFYIESDTTELKQVFSFSFLYSDSIVRTYTDSLSYGCIEAENRLSYSSELIEDFYVYTKHYHFDNLHFDHIDSTLMYFPVLYRENDQVAKQQDTLEMAYLSSKLQQLKEPIIWKKMNVPSFRIFHDQIDSITCYRLEIHDDSVHLNIKEGRYVTDSIIVSSTYDFVLSRKFFSKITLQLEKGKFFSENYDFWLYPRNILIEYCVDGKYYLFNKNIEDIKYDKKNRKLLKIMKWLENYK